jgi:hypothetical protein
MDQKQLEHLISTHQKRFSTTSKMLVNEKDLLNKIELLQHHHQRRMIELSQMLLCEKQLLRELDKLKRKQKPSLPPSTREDWEHVMCDPHFYEDNAKKQKRCERFGTSGPVRSSRHSHETQSKSKPKIRVSEQQMKKILDCEIDEWMHNGEPTNQTEM